MPDQSASIDDYVAQIDRRIRAIAPEAADRIHLTFPPNEAATWSFGRRWATLVAHDGSPFRFELTLHGGDDNPQAMEIGAADADLVDMIARPAADFLIRPPS